MFKTIVDIFFCQTSFLIIKCAPFFFKFGENLNIDDKKKKKIEIDKIIKNTLEHICFKLVFDLENYEY